MQADPYDPDDYVCPGCKSEGGGKCKKVTEKHGPITRSL